MSKKKKRPSKFINRSCAEKQSFATEEEAAAYKALLFYDQKAQETSEIRPDKLCIYKCQVCRCYHVGHEPKDKKDVKRQEQLYQDFVKRASRPSTKNRFHSFKFSDVAKFR